MILFLFLYFLASLREEITIISEYFEGEEQDYASNFFLNLIKIKFKKICTPVSEGSGPQDYSLFCVICWLFQWFTD